jgi:putative holliday junction resolvase
MPIVEPADLPACLAPRQRLLGLDLGSKTIGLAISDPGLVVASPLETIRRKKFTADSEALFALCKEHGVDGLVLGLPRNMDGSEGPRCQSTRQFATNLLIRRDIAIAFWDERLSTAAVERAMISEGDVSRAKRAEAVDRLAAAYILQGYLDSLPRT